MPMLAMMDGIVLLGELAPHIPRNFSFVARDADDKEVAVRSHERRNLTVPQLSQKNARHLRSKGILISRGGGHATPAIANSG